MMMEGWIYEGRKKETKKKKNKKKRSMSAWIIGWMDINPSLNPVRAFFFLNFVKSITSPSFSV